MKDYDEQAARDRVLRHEAMGWVAATMSGSFLHPDLVIERAEAFINYVENGGVGIVHSEDTLARVRVTLVNKLVCSEQGADNLITELLNAGILFRERRNETGVGPIAGEFDLNDLSLLGEPPGAKIDDMQWAAIDEQMTYHHPIAKAKRIVFDYVREQLEKTDSHVTFSGDKVYVVWFCKTLQNWKALVSTTLPDGMYYEVTYDGDQHVAYLDAYKKFQNVPVKL